jgi:CheY-like chemotaxis protein/nitrogen-specific signal transduction histidine kinase
LVSITALRDDYGEVIGYLLIGTDISARKRVEEKLNDAMAAAEKANLAKSNFLAGMSHELRTPLNAILGFAQLLESGTPPATPLQKRSIDQILKAGWYLLELINEILDLALIESGTLTLSAEPVLLAQVLSECRTLIESQAQTRGISMTFPKRESPHFVKADRTRMKQIVINLLFNAIKYNKPGGSVAVEVKPVGKHSIRICVRDTGAGLAPSQLTQLFQPFNRLGKETSAEEGTGIGLVMTKRLVEMMGGTIGVESIVGVGTEFWVEFGLTGAPQLAVHELEQAATPDKVPDGAPVRTILYVEDNPANLELVEQLIARRGDMRLLSASDGEVGIEYARAYLPELILMDINLPGISGVEAMKALRADPTTARIPIIALSANAVPRDIEKALEAGFSDYLTKPINVARFMTVLDQALASARLVPSDVVL